jgi:Integrase core domain
VSTEFVCLSNAWDGRAAYLAVVVDAFSRRCVGCAMTDHMRAELVVDALEIALWHRRPDAGLIHHSDRGRQYVSLIFGQTARAAGIAVSMGAKGCALDNAVCESFFATLKKELTRRRSWPTRRELESAVFAWIEGWYDRRRLHSTLGYLLAARLREQNSRRSRSEPRRFALAHFTDHDHGNGRVDQAQTCPPERVRSNPVTRLGQQPALCRPPVRTSAPPRRRMRHASAARRVAFAQG